MFIYDVAFFIFLRIHLIFKKNAKRDSVDEKRHFVKRKYEEAKRQNKNQKPSQAKPSQAKPSQARPKRRAAAKPRQAKPSQDPPSLIQAGPDTNFEYPRLGVTLHRFFRDMSCHFASLRFFFAIRCDVARFYICL